jgi:hypothetical protein
MASAGKRSPAALNALGLRCKAEARYNEGRALYRRALGLLRRDPAPDWNAIATVYHNLAGIEHARGNFAEGEALARIGLAIRTGLSDADSLESPPGVRSPPCLGQGRDRRPASPARWPFRRCGTADSAAILAALNNLRCPVLPAGIAAGRRLLERAAGLNGARGPDPRVGCHPQLRRDLPPAQQLDRGGSPSGRGIWIVPRCRAPQDPDLPANASSLRPRRRRASDILCRPGPVGLRVRNDLPIPGDVSAQVTFLFRNPMSRLVTSMGADPLPALVSWQRAAPVAGASGTTGPWASATVVGLRRSDL